MDDTAYFAWQGLRIDDAMRAHEARTGRKAQQIICRTADLPEIAKQLRPVDVELRTDNYVQRGTLYLAALVLSLLLLSACEGEVQGYPGRGAMGEATCPAGQHVDAYGTHGVAVCVN
jgi:hypothetical protein